MTLASDDLVAAAVDGVMLPSDEEKDEEVAADDDHVLAAPVTPLDIVRVVEEGVTTDAL